MLVGLVDRVTRRLRAGGRAGRTVVLRLRFDDFSRATRSRTLPDATAASRPVLAAARALLAAARPAIDRRGLTLVGVAVTGLDAPRRRPARAADRRSGRPCARRRPRRRARALRARRGDACGPPRSRPPRAPAGPGVTAARPDRLMRTRPFGYAAGRDRVQPGGTACGRGDDGSCTVGGRSPRRRCWSPSWPRRRARPTATRSSTAATPCATRAAPTSSRTRSATGPARPPRRRHALPHAGHRPRPLPALRPRRTHAGAASPGTVAPTRRPARRRTGRRRRRARLHADRRCPPGSTSASAALGRLAQVPAGARRPLRVRARAGLRELPRGRGERHRHSRSRARARPRACAASSTTTSTSARSSSSAAASTAGGRGAPTGSRWRLQRLRRTTTRTAPAPWSRTSSPRGSPVGTHSTEGWPSFAGWPRDESLTHEGTYWKWIERAWRVGAADHGQRPRREPRALRALPAQAEQLQRDGERVQAGRGHVRACRTTSTRSSAAPARASCGSSRAPTEARAVINDGKLAVVLGVEVSEVSTAGSSTDVPKCTAAQIDARARRAPRDRRAVAVPGAQVRQRARRHASSTAGRPACSSTRATSTRRASSGTRRALRRRPTTTTSPRTPTGASYAAPVCQLFGPVHVSRCSRGSCRSIRPAPLCNPKGLTALGEHVIRPMMRRGHDRRDRPHEREGAPADALDPRGREATPA